MFLTCVGLQPKDLHKSVLFTIQQKGKSESIQDSYSESPLEEESQQDSSVLTQIEVTYNKTQIQD